MCEIVNHRPGFWILAVSQSESCSEDVSEESEQAPTFQSAPSLLGQEVDTMSENAPTYDELLAKLNEAQSQNKELSEKIESTLNKVTSLEDSLAQARALNTKLMFNDPSVPAQMNLDPEPDDEPETLDQFIDSFAKVAVHNVNLKYGEKIYGDDN